MIDCGTGFYNDGINNCVDCNSDYCEDCTVGTGVCIDCMESYYYNSDNDTCYCPYPETYWVLSDDLCHDIELAPSG